MLIELLSNLNIISEILILTLICSHHIGRFRPKEVLNCDGSHIIFLHYSHKMMCDTLAIKFHIQMADYIVFNIKQMIY